MNDDRAQLAALALGSRAVGLGDRTREDVYDDIIAWIQCRDVRGKVALWQLILGADDDLLAGLVKWQGARESNPD